MALYGHFLGHFDSTMGFTVFFYPPEGYVIFDMCFSCRTAGCLALQGGAPGEEGGPLPARGNHLHQVRNIINLHIRPGFPANKEQRK